MSKKDGLDDLRVRRTQKAIRGAFFELIKEKGFEHISVKDITDRALISRNTFYLHYADKYDLFNKICDDLMRTLFFRAGKRLRRAQQNDFDVESVAAIIKSSILAIEENKEEYLILFSVSGTSNILTDKINQISKLFLNSIKDDIEGISEWSMAYIVAGIAGFIRYYVLNGIENLDEECLNFSKIHFKSIIEIAQNTRNKKD
ncbi:MAG: TetR/AcrR family transcriptional regulator [Eubacterium sp.]|nr:TetR/AcrR family transcriptional regulator [Eubacterium sp.]MDE6155592.1 TetR/AcrR family transcriptional regulator [Eubacterium sp.]MDE6767369.1 TetR/AcrR family transcriptional regulator [Eubacterium sp.]